MDRKPASFRLTIVALRLLSILSESLGLSHTAVVETAIRELAKRNKITFIPTERGNDENDDAE
jgi:hypothetical protein